ncbi:hypothetical protein P2G88_13570 [Aliiglaciecola sp. CAU 1673]|uniref:hypothetical protein n=1 Tax=Aliiglaciecola sp. CAU 1673 TaxID=3032595 RepID=UPI0023D9AEA1|nr:hypothetical protein [Aliiglaciecola sp. CAU 1673]MDF2179284.1 hypothetical protein [Aliiglaciecola sp. CAU 1673]
MIRLSRKGWNNVLIFATLLMILLFNQSGRFLTDGEPATSHTLLPTDIPLMKLEFGAHQLERIGQGWRVRPASSLDEAQLMALVDHWQQALLIPMGEADLDTGIVVVAWLAGEAQGRIFRLVERDDSVWVAYDKKLFQIQNKTLDELVPEALR